MDTKAVNYMIQTFLTETVDREALMIRASAIGNMKIYEILQKQVKTSKKREMLEEAIAHCQYQIAEAILKNKLIDYSILTHGLGIASEHGRYRIVKLLLENRLADRSATGDEAIRKSWIFCLNVYKPIKTKRTIFLRNSGNDLPMNVIERGLASKV